MQTDGIKIEYKSFTLINTFLRAFYLWKPPNHDLYLDDLSYHKITSLSRSF
ncbi:hypothetical protein TPHV1_40185 [Treponema phagedenis]|uniref:Uncharacterized protein n=1 Tax=Treponema phagedenis TaxID=162 RepID=A0A0B7GYG9_TREPH|nr:hypothetical protein TPHV1_40185 [Treponema phagedenis]